MPGEALHNPRFLDDKQTFFKVLDIRKKKRIPTSAADVERWANNHNYGFTGEVLEELRTEFHTLYEVLRKDGANRERFRLYCYYCLVMLENAYKASERKNEAERYASKRKELKEGIEKGYFEEAEVRDGFFMALGKDIGNGIIDLVTAPESTSKAKKLVGISNLARIYWYFCRTMNTLTLNFSREAGIIDKLAKLLDKEIDVDKIIGTLETPNEIFRFLSIGFFAIRFIINSTLILKHTFFPGEGEEDLVWWKRFFESLFRYHIDMLNDGVWFLVNLFTNYNKVFHIAAPVAGWMVAGFMFFDFCLIMYRRFWAEREYLAKRAQYSLEQEHFKKLMNNANLSDAERKQYEKHYQVLTEQLKELEIEWKTTNATFWFYGTAALLLMAGFSASMVLTPAIAVIGCYMACTLAVAMYLSGGAYSRYKKASLVLEQARMDGKNDNIALREYQAARNDFIFTMVENALIPSLLILTYAICWQAALVLTAVYIGYKLYSAYDSYQHKKTLARDYNAGLQAEHADANENRDEAEREEPDDGYNVTSPFDLRFVRPCQA